MTLLASNKCVNTLLQYFSSRARPELAEGLGKTQGSFMGWTLSVSPLKEGRIEANVNPKN
jgi:hypothetical protein